MGLALLLIRILLMALGISAVLTVLFFLMIMPGMAHRVDMKPFTEYLYAHRGLHDNASAAPENSMPAFAKAVEAGYGIELDIQLSKDGIPVVFHDFTLKRACGVEGKVCDYSFEELQRWRLFESETTIPKFEDVLGLVAGRVPLIVEFKIELFDISLCPAADRLLQDYQGPYCMESFNPLGVGWYRRHRPDVCRGQLSDAFLKEGEYKGILHFFLQNLLFNFFSRPDFVAYNRKYPEILSRRLCRGLFHNTAAAWTIKSREELEKAREQFDIFIFEGFVP